MLSADESEILAGLRAYHPDGDVIELRIPGAGKYKATVSGYYDDYEAAARDAAGMTNHNHPQGTGKTPAVYFTLNKIDQDLLARYYNRMEYRAKETTADNDVVSLEWLPIDVDAVRPSNISATDEEHDNAIRKALEIRDYLASIGWPQNAFMVADSGNGGHLVVKIRLENNKSNIDLIKRCIETLGKKFSDDKSKVDATTFNPSRIWKVPGTVVRKGDDTPSRPYRIARIIECPDTYETVTENQLKALVGSASVDVDWIKNMSADSQTEFSPRAYAELHGANISRIDSWIDKEGGKWEFAILDTCPFNSGHNRGEARIGKRKDGKRTFGCFHESCKGKGWHDLRDLWEPGWRDRAARAATGGYVGQPAAVVLPGSYTLNNRGNVARLIDLHGQDLKYVREYKDWITWTGKNWARDETAPFSAVDDLIRGLYEEAQTAPDSDTRKKLAAFAAECGNNSAYNATLALAAKNTAFSMSVLELDSNDCVLNMQNGTLDLNDFQLYPHEQSQNLVKIVDYDFDQDAKCDRWTKFLNDTFEGNQDIIEYIQRVMGYSLTGSMAEKCFFFLYGAEGDNGKSVFLAVMRKLGGEYAKNADISTFLLSKNERVRDDLAALIGSRIITTAEPEEGSRFSMTVIKSWTGGDPQTCRELYGKFFTYPPKGKIFLAANNRPAIYERTDAAWSRVHIIPFNKSIAKENQDKNLIKKLEDEMPGILNWALDGLKDYKTLGGLYPPQIIMDAVRGYRKENDSIKIFVEECCTFAEGHLTHGPRLYAAYKEFCQNAGLKPLGLGKFNGAMLETCKDKGIERTKQASGYIWKGIMAVTPYYVGGQGA